ncbi:MAG: SOS response-associated peptidase [Saprospirales bacterium]|nr:MAG: SOS response-associated peptidase [Saprospirales bacterium]
MCGRLTLSSDYTKIEEQLGLTMDGEQIDVYNRNFPNYNGAPTQLFPVLAQSYDENHLHFMKWGLIPSWAKDHRIGYKTINARAETAMVKPSFRQAFTKRRCLIAVDGYYEWKNEDSAKQPYRICKEDQSVFALCGLWEKWIKPGTNLPIETFTIITMPSRGKISSLHDRMPLSISKEHFELWLRTEFQSSEFEEFLEHCSNVFTFYYRVSKSVNSVRNNSPELIERLGK